MHLIGNCCISNHILRKYGYGNINPFTWVNLDFNSFFVLLTQYNTIDWSIIDIVRDIHPYKKGYNQYSIIVDDKVKIDYVHCLFEPNMNKPTTINGYTRYNKIWEYIVDKYHQHTTIMLESKLSPYFILEWEHLDYNDTNFNKLLNTDLTYKVSIITNNTSYTSSNPNLQIIYDKNTKGSPPNGKLPEYFCNTYHQQIMQFFNS